MVRRGKMNTAETEKDTELYDKIETHFENQLERTNFWLSFAEAKNGAIIAINVALIAVLITIFDKAPIFCVIAISCFLASCTLGLISFIPNTKSRPDVNTMTSGEELNLLFYGDVASIETTERYIELSINRYFSGRGMTLVNKLVYDLASEVLINSWITIKKYNCFKNAVKLDFMALVLIIIFLCVA